MNRRWLGTALVVTLLATAWLALQGDDEPLSSPSPSPSPTRAAPARPNAALAATGSAPLPVANRLAWAPLSDLALAAWGTPAVTPAPPPLPAASAAPTAPAFPYQWIGRLQEGNEELALLSSANRSFGARPGEVLDGRWRIDRIAATRLELTWLPSGDAVSLPAR